METPVNTDSLDYRFAKHVHEKGASNEELFNILNTCIDYLGLKSPKEVSEIEKISIQRIYKKYKNKMIEIKGVKLIKYNE